MTDPVTPEPGIRCDLCNLHQSQCPACDTPFANIAAENARLVARVAELEVALCDAAGQSYDWSAYAGEYLRDKYGAAAETGGWLAKIPRDRLDAIIAAESASPKAARTWADEMLAAHDAREKR